jgi:hypothetical protein
VGTEHTTTSMSGCVPSFLQVAGHDLFRREAGDWKIIHRRGDLTTRPPLTPTPGPPQPSPNTPTHLTAAITRKPPHHIVPARKRYLRCHTGLRCGRRLP